MSSAPESNFGRRLLPSYVDEIALSDPNRILYSITKTRNPADGFQDISASVFARAVNRCAWYLEKNLGRATGTPTLLYIGPQDLVYAILILASTKAGYKLLTNSPRNTLDAHLSLLEQTDCNTFLLPPNFPLPVVKEILTARQMRVVNIAPLQHWLDADPEGQEGSVYPYNKTYAEARLEPWVVLHTSGSTGSPKPILQNHATYSPIDAFKSVPENLGGPAYPAECKGRRMYLGLPLFHCAGVNIALPCALFNEFVIVLGPFPPTADVVDAVHQYGNIQESVQAPTVLVELAKNPAAVERLSKLEQLSFGGGPLPPDVGNLLSTRTRLHSALGSTEAGVFPGKVVVTQDRRDWAYMGISPAAGVEYRHVTEDLYEQVIVRKPDLELYQGIFGTFPHLREWPMKDLYSPHPTRKDAWLYRGRSDDVIVYSTGEKLSPLQMEDIIQENPAVSAALIGGTGRFQSSLLIELAAPAQGDVEVVSKKQELLDAIWVSVEAANQVSPSHGRIHRDMILFTSPGKPMLRAGKGTVQRQATLKLYDAELNELYNAIDGPSIQENGSVSDGNVADVVKSILAESTGLPLNDVDSHADLFELGLDSLQVTVISRKLNVYLTKLGKPATLAPKTVYSNSSVQTLVDAVSDAAGGKGLIESTRERPEQQIQRLYTQYTKNLPVSARQAQKTPSELTVLLTGSTGSLGSYILDSLVQNSRVSRIYCLNRGPKSLVRQQKSLEAKGLTPLDTNKVVCLDADWSKSLFGLRMDEYKTLLESVTNVVHNAWQVDFNLSVQSFANHIAVVRQLVDFSAHARYGPSIFFISSISSVGNWSETTETSQPEGASSNKNRKVPQKMFHNPNIPESIGYGQSKSIAERVLDTAAIQANIPAVVCRVGQASGPTTADGVWPKTEWLPSLVASSKFLGKLPDSLGQVERVDWVPVDLLGRIIVELAVGSSLKHTRSTTGADVYHVTNPSPTEWRLLVPTIAKFLDVGTVPLNEWVKALKQSDTGSEDQITSNPALKLLHFYAGLVSNQENTLELETNNAVRDSVTMSQLQPVQETWVKNWLKQWSF